MLRRNIAPIVDLCHFGVPDWLGNFQNPDFPALFAQYAKAFAQRFLSLDLNHGRRVNPTTYEFLMDNGMTREAYYFFLITKMKRHCHHG